MPKASPNSPHSQTSVSLDCSRNNHRSLFIFPPTPKLAISNSHVKTMLTLLVFLLILHPTPSLSLTPEGLLLLKAKSSLSDPSSSLSSWNPNDPSPCNWSFVTCSSSSSSVTSLDLSNLNLVGPFPASLCLLPKLQRLSLSNNYINSTLPSSSLLPCSSLTHLDLSQNILVGPLPSTLHLLPSLLHLDLSSNNFSGDIPTSFGWFPRLQNLTLVNNLLNHAVPAFLGNVSSLRQLNLSYNPFAPGPIPAEFGNLTLLDTLWLAQCNLVGKIPTSLGNLRHLRNLDLSQNGLVGQIPKELSMLKSAFQIELYSNLLTGEIPLGIANLTSLQNIDLSMNQLVGTITPDFFRLPLLESLNLYQNRLVGGVPKEAGSAAKLSELRLFSNQLTGTLPHDLGSKSPLVFVDLSQNLFSGEVPPAICDMGTLQELLMIHNMLSGSIPEGLGRCRSLLRLRLSNNLLSGEVPPGLWCLPHIYLVDLARNSLSGVISTQISGGTNISSLIISSNHFSGSIPDEVGALSKLYEFSAANNHLSGFMPSALGSLSELGTVDISNNSLSGELLRDITSWRKLTELNLAMNQLTGNIPPELASLPVLNYLDLSNNLLTGEIPIQLQNLTLNRFNFSNNQLTGSIPPLFATATFKNSFLGNPGLCGDIEGLCSSVPESGGRHRGYLWLLGSIFILAGIVLLAGITWFAWKYRKFQRRRREIGRPKWTLMSFHKLGFNEFEILDCLDEDNVIGSGASGKVYKAVLSNGETVAVKKLWGLSKKEGHDIEGQNKDGSFEAEVETLGKIRHKNIVKLWCCCSNRDCKLLVYEYMPNGSLGDLLHSGKSWMLNWQTRYKIALNAAEGLSYLHHDCVPAIVHRDIKANNILLDAEFCARVADFGVAKVVDSSRRRPNSMSIIAGSCGYIAPEYAYTMRVNEKSDIYSFGVVILELVTGRRPVEPEFGEKDLVKWVCSTLDQKGLDHVMDPKLDKSFRKEIGKTLNIGLQCASSLPMNRPSMRRVVTMLLDVGEQQQQGEGREDRGHPPLLVL